MQITITGRHVDVPDEIKEYSHKKAEKLLRFYDRIQAIDVLWDHEGEQFSVEMIVNAGSRHTFISREVGPDAVRLIDQAVDKLERQLTKHKEKSRNRMHLSKKPPPTEDLEEGV